MSAENIKAVLNQFKPMDCEQGKIRIGTMGDGGYVVPNDLDGIDKVVSLGVGVDVSFDEVFANQGANIYQYDHTVDNVPIENENFHFQKQQWVPVGSPDGKSLPEICEDNGIISTNNAILKFDVEGDEWLCLREVPADLFKHFRIIVCELHGLHNLANDGFLFGAWSIMNKLLYSHQVVHFHINNCCGVSILDGVLVPKTVEITLLRKDRSDFCQSMDTIPSSLDFPNMPPNPDIQFSF